MTPTAQMKLSMPPVCRDDVIITKIHIKPRKNSSPGCRREYSHLSMRPS
jgi:hypothetical protein